MDHQTNRPTAYLQWRVALSLALLLFTIYLLTYRGGFHSIDEVSMFAVTESMVKFGSVNTDQIAWTQWTTSQAEAQGFFGPDGHVYSKKGLALSLAQAGLYWLALMLPGLGMLQTVSLLNALVTAATGAILFLFLQRLNFSQSTALLTSLIFGLATIAFVYAKYLFSEPLAGLLLLLAAYLLFGYRQEGSQLRLALAGLAAGLAVLTRANNLFLLPIFGLYLLWVETQRRPAAPTWPTRFRRLLPPLLTFGLGLAIPGLLLLTYNALRSGNPLQTGYDLTLFSPNILLGLYKLLFSPLRGLFVYSPILLLSLPGWWYLHRRHPAEAWLLAGLVGVTLALFSAWSSGEGLSWGSRFLVPIIPLLALCLAPLLESGPRLWRVALYLLLPPSLLIQILGVTINPWVYLAQLQASFGGEFFLEKTAALYDVRYSQILGQWQNWTVIHSDLVWWQPWGFDGLTLALSLGLLLTAGGLLWLQLKATRASTWPLAAVAGLTLLVTYLLLARYYHTDRQFGLPADGYSQALYTAAAQAAPADTIVTVAQNHYHVPMNRFKARRPLLGFAQQRWPPPQTALPLLSLAATAPNSWLVTHGFPPAAPNNAAEQWLALNTFKASDTWLPDEVRLVHFSARRPTLHRPVDVRLGTQFRLAEIRLLDPLPAGRILPVEFTWESLQSPTTNYTLFLQLLDSAGQLVAQHDSPPNGGYSPTSTWQTGQPITSRHALSLPADLPSNDYHLIAGLYDPATGQRLVTDSGSDFVELGKVTIIGSEK